MICDMRISSHCYVLVLLAVLCMELSSKYICCNDDIIPVWRSMDSFSGINLIGVMRIQSAWYNVCVCDFSSNECRKVLCMKYCSYILQNGKNPKYM